MGVPITFMNKYNPDEFEILGLDRNIMAQELGSREIGDKWSEPYKRQGGKAHYTASMHSLVYTDTKGIATAVYRRVIIKAK